MNIYAAKLICKSMKYTDGVLISDDNNRNICNNYKGEDFCGPEGQPIFY